MNYRFDPAFLVAEESRLEESAALQLESCPAVLALLVRRMEGHAKGFDQASSFDKVRELQGRRRELQWLLGLREEVLARSQQKPLDGRENQV